jgi:hypothetical protein
VGAGAVTRIDRFRRLALALPEAVEMSHFDLASFRVGKRIFATIHEDDARVMVKFTPEQQEEWCERHAGTVYPVPGRWGEGGATFIDLRTANVSLLKEALRLAWANAAPKRLL